MGVRRAVIERIFKVSNIGGAFEDAQYGVYANSAAITQTCTRKGQLVIATKSAIVDAVFVGTASAGETGTSAWTEIPSG